MKKKLLIVNESLTLAGGEKSLIALLSNLDPELYEMDLQLFKYGGELDAFIPNYVNVLPPFQYSEFASKSLLNNVLNIFKRNHFRYLKSKITYSIGLRKKSYNNPEKAQVYWEAVSNSIESSKTIYDFAIAYAQGVPTFYVIDKVKAANKIAWVNVNVKFPEKNKEFNYSYYSQFDKIVCVSDGTETHFSALYPNLKDKLITIYDLLDYKSIIKMADLYKTNFESSTFNILTVARLNLSQKGYDITLETCKILRDKGKKFHWYAIGEGSYRKNMEEYLKDNNLNDYFTFLGTTANPYPYFKAADLYVQTSRHEGFGLSIAEARLLNVPVVTTRFDTVFMQMINNKNGLVTDMNAQAVADAIERLMEDKALYKSIVAYLRQEMKENNEPVKQFNLMIEDLWVAQ